MNGIYLYFVNKHLSSWVLLGLKGKSLYVYALLPNEKALDYDFLKTALLQQYDY